MSRFEARLRKLEVIKRQGRDAFLINQDAKGLWHYEGKVYTEEQFKVAFCIDDEADILIIIDDIGGVCDTRPP